MKVYLDNCCFNRPFDNQLNLRIKLESEAKLKIQEDIRSGIYKLIWSYVLDYENSQNPFKERREQISRWALYAVDDIQENVEILCSAENLRKIGFKKMDALHLACALIANADFFLTTDDGILKKVSLIQNTRINDPIEFIKITML